MAETKKQIFWSAPEFVHYQKGQVWFFFLTVIGLGFAVYFFVQKDFLTATLFLLMFIIVFGFAKAKPKTMQIVLDGAGIKFNESRIPYQQLKTFWIVYNPPETKTLNFESSAYVNRFITLQLENEDPVKIRRFLLEYLPEDLDRNEHLSHRIARALRF